MLFHGQKMLDTDNYQIFLIFATETETDSKIFFHRNRKPLDTGKIQVLCAIIFGDIATHLKVIADFKSQKIIFLKGTTFRCVATPPKVMAHNTSSFLFLEILKKRSNSLR